MEYYDRISEVRKTGNYEQWVNFFLQAIITSVNDEIKSINELNTLKEITTKRIQESNYSNHDKLVLLEFIKYLEQKPIISIGKTKTDLNISFNFGSTIILKLESLNVLIQVNKGKRNRRFIYKEYLDIIKKGIE